jgi:hypothetical protein
MRVTKFLFVFLAVLALMPVMVIAASAPSKDAVGIGAPTLAAAGDNGATRRVTVPLNLDNTHQLVAMDIPLRFGSPGDGLNLVNVEYASRVDYFDEKITNIDNENKTVVMGLLAMAYDPSTPDLEVGSGPVAYLTFDVTDPAIESFTIASARINTPAHRLMQVWHEQGTDGQLEVRWNDQLEFSETVQVSTASASPIPHEYALDQNYPNPFNAGTVIGFALKDRGHVSVTVFNVLGQTVRVLADEEMEPGYRSVSWDGRDGNGNTSASGVYFYRIAANSFNSTKKMTLIK